MDDMRDDAFLAAVQQNAVPGGFDHTAHLRAAWILIRRHGIGAGGDALADMIRALADAAGAPQKFHKTMTWAFVLLVAEAIDRDPTADSWPAFARGNPHLLEWPNDALLQRWSSALLATDEARTRLVLPDGAPVSA